MSGLNRREFLGQSIGALFGALTQSASASKEVLKPFIMDSLKNDAGFILGMQQYLLVATSDRHRHMLNGVPFTRTPPAGLSDDLVDGFVKLSGMLKDNPHTADFTKNPEGVKEAIDIFLANVGEGTKFSFLRLPYDEHDKFMFRYDMRQQAQNLLDVRNLGFNEIKERFGTKPEPEKPQMTEEQKQEAEKSIENRKKNLQEKLEKLHMSKNRISRYELCNTGERQLYSFGQDDKSWRDRLREDHRESVGLY